MPIAKDTPLTITEAAEFLRVTPKAVYHLVQRGRIPSYKPGKRLYFRWEDLRDFVFQNRRASNGELAEIAERLLIDGKQRRTRGEGPRKGA